jgi:hypothetical protein
MTSNPTIIRKAYDTVALLAVLNLLGLGGLAAYIVGTGAVDGEKLREIAAVVRGDQEPQTQAAPTDEQTEVVAEPLAPAVGGDALAESQVNREIMRREAERIKAELDQRLALNNSILLRVMTERECFNREREEAQKQREASVKQRREDGFKKQIDIYESIAPKIAVEHLLAMPEPDDAARVLVQMNTRKARKIVEAAKRGNKMERMKVILQRVREVAPDRSTELAPS